jgi:hypothetical protein
MLFTTTSRGTVIAAAAMLVLALVATFAEAKKKSSFPVITGVKPYIACDVCRELVAAAAFWRDEVVANCTASGRKLTEGEVYEKAVESLCNPLTEGGDWLRRLDWQVDAAATSVTFAARSSFGKCKGKCYTGAEICRDIVDSDDADDFSGLLYSRAKAEKIIKTVCANACKAQRAAAKKAASGGSVLRRDWGAEQFEEIDEKEKEIEEMMERMTLDGKSGPGMDVFSRDEMKELRTAMDTGDFDRVQELDPTFSDMDEADFNMMRHMAAAEDSVGSGGRSTLSGQRNRHRDQQRPNLLRIKSGNLPRQPLGGTRCVLGGHRGGALTVGLCRHIETAISIVVCERVGSVGVTASCRSATCRERCRTSTRGTWLI